MSLILDARKKSQQSQSAHGADNGLSGFEAGQGSYQESHPLDDPRNAGRNLFTAKSPASSFARAGMNRNLLIALGGTVLLLTVGAAYVWYIVSADNTQLQRAVKSNVIASLAKPAPATTGENSVKEIISPLVAPPKISGTKQAAHPSHSATKKRLPQVHNKNTVLIERQAEPIDDMLSNAYLAYRNGQFEQAQQRYREVLRLDSHNTDALLGMAAIAQHRGLDDEATHYYAQTLVLDPRNAVANAGMSALSTDDNRESRLKHLLNEQQDSSSLHFALGNHYAEQSRWADAQQSYSNAYKLDPDNAELAFNMAVSLEQLGQNKSAAQYYQRALQLDKSNSAGFDHAQIEQRVQELAR